MSDQSTSCARWKGFTCIASLASIISVPLAIYFYWQGNIATEGLSEAQARIEQLGRETMGLVEEKNSLKVQLAEQKDTLFTCLHVLESRIESVERSNQEYASIDGSKYSKSKDAAAIELKAEMLALIGTAEEIKKILSAISDSINGDLTKAKEAVEADNYADSAVHVKAFAAKMKGSFPILMKQLEAALEKGDVRQPMKSGNGFPGVFVPRKRTSELLTVSYLQARGGCKNEKSDEAEIEKGNSNEQVNSILNYAAHSENSSWQSKLVFGESTMNSRPSSIQSSTSNRVFKTSSATTFLSPIRT